MAALFLNSKCASLRLLFFLDTKSTRLFHHSTLENQETLPFSFPHFFRLVISACPGSCKSPTTTCQAVELFPSNGVRQRWGENSCCRVLVHVNREVLHSVRRNFLDGMLRSGCEFRKLIPKRSLKRSIETESERNSVDHFRKVHSLVQW